MSTPRFLARSVGILSKAVRVPQGQVRPLQTYGPLARHAFNNNRTPATTTSAAAGLSPLWSSAKPTPACRYTSSPRRIPAFSPVRSYASAAPSSGTPKSVKNKNTDMLYYTASILIAVLGLSYAAVPVYRMVCSTTGMGGAPQVHETKFAPERLMPKESHRRIKIRFNADTSTSLQWTFVPQQRHVSVLPGETALAFYTAENKSDEDVIGIATYNVAPSKVAAHFNKIQCFCFEEQKLMAGEKVDMPIFFFLDPEFATDPDMQDVDTIVLSYTFFKARGMPFEQQPGLVDQKKA